MAATEEDAAMELHGEPDRLTVTNRGRHPLWVVAFMLLFLVAWAVFGWIAFPGLVRQAREDVHLLGAAFIFVVLGSAFWLLMLYALLGLLFAREEVELSGGRLGLRPLGLRRRRRWYAAAHVQRLRQVPEPHDQAPTTRDLAVGYGTIAFEYGPRTVRLGRYLAPEETRRLLHALHTRLAKAGPAAEDTEPLPTPRSRTSQRGDGLEVILPALRDWVTVAFVSGCFTFLSVFAAEVLTRNPHWRGPDTPAAADDLLGTALMLAAWGLLCFMLAWQLWGSEVVRVRDGALTLETRVRPCCRKRVFAAGEVARLRVEERPRRHGQEYPLAGLNEGNIAFEYRGRTHRFGIDLDPAEARLLVHTVQPYLGEASP